MLLAACTLLVGAPLVPSAGAAGFNLTIPLGAPASTSGAMTPATLEVTDPRPIFDVDIAIRIEHTLAPDLDITLVHPDGTKVELSTDNGAGSDYGAGSADCAGDLTVFDDSATTSVRDALSPAAGRVHPEENLAKLAGKPAAGTWQLLVNDDAAGDWGFLACFEVRLAEDHVVPVTTTADVVDPADGVTSLREAFTMAGGDTRPTVIDLAPGARYTLRCSVPGDDNANVEGDLDVYLRDRAAYITLNGHGASIAADGCVDERLIEFVNVLRVTLRDLDLVGGRGLDRGGALRIGDADRVVLERVRVTNTTTSEGATCTTNCSALGAVAIESRGTVAIVDTVVADGQARLDRCQAACAGIGGLFLKSGFLATVTRSVFSRNQVSFGVCTAKCEATGGAAVNTLGTAVDSTAVIGNRAVAPGCATCDAVGGLELRGDSTFVNTTISDNVAQAGSAIGGLLRRTGSAGFRFSTVVDNMGPSGVSNLALLGPGPFSALGVVVGSAAGVSGCDVRAALQASYFSFESGTGCLPAGRGVVASGGDPRLAAAGAQRPWRAPDAGSPVIDMVPAESCIGADVRGQSRLTGAACDVGAVEFVPALVPPPPPPPPGVAASRFVALPPLRVLDTRPGTGGPGPEGLVGAGEHIDLQVAGRAGVPAAGVAAVVLNVTATQAAGPGFVTVWPAGTPRPNASNLNLTGPDQTRANLVTVPVSPDGKVSLFTEAGAHLIADVAGYFEAVEGPQTAGRIVTMAPTRLFDTRLGDPAAARPGIVAGGESITVRVAGNAGLPPSGAAAVILNLTATDATSPGYVTAWPAGSERPLASVLNLNAAGETAPNLVMVPLGADGSIELYASAGAHLLADVTGYVTDASAAVSTSGLFVALAPTRVFDTRPDTPAGGPKAIVDADTSISTPFAGSAGVPVDAAGVVVNLTATGAVGQGFVTSWPSGTPRPLASSLNVVGGDTRANAAILPLGGGALEHYSFVGTHLLADVAGYVLP